MSVNPGARIGPYEVVAHIGSGGMGDVYRARDTKLQRDVALKVLPDVFATDPERLARFQREAQVLASLNHPNIAIIHGLEEAEGVRALVLEFVEGPTLQEILAGSGLWAVGSGPVSERPAQSPKPKAQSRALSVEEALPIARQIAEALEAAHEHGIVHRDLKPANVKVRPDGTVKVLDFGLAKLVASDVPNASVAQGFSPAEGPGLSQAPTLTTPAATRMGVIMGTAAYMSPEQARGKPVDKRADIWAFGCLLYEMLTGRRAFEGDDVTDTLAAVVRGQPDWNALPAATSASLRFLLNRCLEKDPKHRLHDIADFRILLDRAPAPSTAPARTHPSRARVLTAVGAVIMAAVVSGVTVWMLRPQAVRPVRRFAISLAEGVQFGGLGRQIVALSPDGTRLVYVADDRLYLRSMDRLEGEAVRGTEGGRGPFFSPDGQWIGFWQNNQLKKVSITGGAPVALCEASAPTGASWGADDTILFGQGTEGVSHVAGTGGEPSVVIQVDSGKGEVAYGPQMLPGGLAVLFTLGSTAQNWNDAKIVVQTLDTGARHVLVEGGTDARYLPTGHLVYAREGVLLAIPFDLEALRTTGGPVSLVEGVRASFAVGGIGFGSGGGQSGAAFFTVSGDGSLGYVPGGVATAARTLVWVDRQGREEEVAVPHRAYVYPNISPDGTRVALDVRDQERDIWIWDFTRGTFTRLTSDQAPDVHPRWTSDGGRIVFTSSRAGSQNLYWQAADGTGAAERLSESESLQLPTAFSADGTRLVFTDQGRRGDYDIGILQLQGERRPELVMTTTFNEINADVSPDGRWVAYQSDESGRYEIYLRPFPDMASARRLISTTGGTRPVWAQSGRELFYLAPDGALMAVPVETSPTLTVGAPVKLFDGPYYAGLNGRTYDVAPDGQRFLMIKDIGSAAEAAAQIIIVENWFEELKARVPTN